MDKETQKRNIEAVAQTQHLTKEEMRRLVMSDYGKTSAEKRKKAGKMDDHIRKMNEARAEKRLSTDK